MAVMVIGATGFIGPHVVRALVAEGAEVVAVSRSGGGPHGVAADRGDPAALAAIARERRVTAVVDLLAMTAADTLPLLDAMDRVRWVMASSCDVYRNYEGLHRKAAPPRLPGPLAEDSPLRTQLYPYRAERRRDADAADAAMDDYDKIPLEAAVRAGFADRGTILRLPMVFGPGDKQRRFRWLLKPMLSGAARIEADPGWLAFRSTYGFVADVGHALAKAALHPAAGGRTFNIGEPAPTDNRDWIGRFADRLGWRGEIAETPAAPDGPLAGLDLGYSLVIDTTAFRDACGWREPTAPDEALRLTADDEAARR